MTIHNGFLIDTNLIVTFFLNKEIIDIDGYGAVTTSNDTNYHYINNTGYFKENLSFHQMSKLQKESFLKQDPLELYLDNRFRLSDDTLTFNLLDKLCDTTQAEFNEEYFKIFCENYESV